MSVPARDLSFLRVYLCSLDEVLHDFLPDAGAQFGIGAVDVHLGQRDVEVGLALGFVVGLEEPLGLGPVAGLEAGLLYGGLVFEVIDAPRALNQTELRTGPNNRRKGVTASLVSAGCEREGACESLLHKTPPPFEAAGLQPSAGRDFDGIQFVWMPAGTFQNSLPFCCGTHSELFSFKVGASFVPSP
jgi:hypothetical protein